MAKKTAVADVAAAPASEGVSVVKADIREKPTKDYLRCMFTQDERNDFSAELAEAIAKSQQLGLHKKDVMKSIDADIAKTQSRINELAAKVKDGYEMRNIDCTWQYNYDTGEKTLIRNDTKEVVRTQAMSADELQVPLPLPLEEGQTPSQEKAASEEDTSAVGKEE